MIKAMSNIDRIIQQAANTFCKSNKSYFQDNFKKLVSMTNELTLSDVYLTKDFIWQHEFKRLYDRKNPVIFISIYNDLNVQVTLFILKSKSKITLHDHPLMYGILKVLSGKVNIQNYSTSSTNIKTDDLNDYQPDNSERGPYYPYTISPLPVQKHEPVCLGEENNCTVITPFDCNLHEVTSISEPSVFFDILAPPYMTPLFEEAEPLRECNYFKEEYDESSIVLVPYYGKTDYWCIQVPYRGPSTFQ